MAIVTKAQIAAKIIEKIAEITTNRGITKVAVAEILTDIVNLATPELQSGDSVEIYNLDGHPVYEKIIFEPDGVNLPNMDLTLPEGHKIISLVKASQIVSRIAMHAYFTVASVTEVGNLLEKVNIKLEIAGHNPFVVFAPEIDLLITYGDDSTEEITVPCVQVDQNGELGMEGTAELQKDFTTLGDNTTINIKVITTDFSYRRVGEEDFHGNVTPSFPPEGTELTYNDDPIDLTDEYYEDDEIGKIKLGWQDEWDQSSPGTPVFSHVSQESVIHIPRGYPNLFTIAANRFDTNIFVTIRHIDLNEPD